MDPMTRVRGAVGGVVVETLLQRQALRLKARRRKHRGPDGRVTPFLEWGARGGDTFVWLHGFSDRPETFLNASVPLKEDYRIVAPCMPGFGRGFVDHSYTYGLEAYADVVAHLIEQVADGPVHLSGNSLGGAVGLAVARLRPELVRSLAPVNAAGVRVAGSGGIGDMQERGENPFFIRSRADHKALNARVFPNAPEGPRIFTDYFYTKAYTSRPWYEKVMGDLVASSDAMGDGGDEVIAELNTIDRPTRVIWGLDDGLFPEVEGRAMAAAIPRAEFEGYEGVGHCPHLERPKKLGKSLREFARRVEQGEAGEVPPPRAAMASAEARD